MKNKKIVRILILTLICFGAPVAAHLSSDKSLAANFVSFETEPFSFPSFAEILSPEVKVFDYIGCYKDTSDFDLNGYLERSPKNTPQRCIGICRSKGFKYAGVQYGESCLCGNSYGKYGTATNCDYKCTGDGGKICGGYNANSIYTTGAESDTKGGTKDDSGESKGNFAGDWYVGEWGNITFNQRNGKVSGTYTRGGGTIYGNATGNRLNGAWQQQNRQGIVYFNILSDGTIEGKYCEGKGCNVENGTYFTGRRL